MDAAALAEAYVPLARRLAWGHVAKYPGDDPADVESDALLGLWDAARRYDPQLGAAFPTFARSRIFGSIADGRRARDGGARSDRDLMKRINRAHYQFAQAHGRYPDRQELAQAAKLSERKIAEVTVRWHLSRREWMPDIDGQAFTEGIATLAELIPDRRVDVEGEVLSRQTRAIIAPFLDRLTRDEHLAIALYYWDEMTGREIGEVMGVTESRVSQILTRAREKLRHMLREQRADIGIAA